MKVQTHLMFDTTSPEAMKFYQDELGATVVLEMPRWYDDDDDQRRFAPAPRHQRVICA